MLKLPQTNNVNKEQQVISFARATPLEKYNQILSQCIEYAHANEKEFMSVEGLFRITADPFQVEKIYQKIINDPNSHPLSEETQDPLVMMSIVKQGLSALDFEKNPIHWSEPALSVLSSFQETLKQADGGMALHHLIQKIVEIGDYEAGKVLHNLIHLSHFVSCYSNKNKVQARLVAKLIASRMMSMTKAQLPVDIDYIFFRGIVARKTLSEIPDFSLIQVNNGHEKLVQAIIDKNGNFKKNFEDTYPQAHSKLIQQYAKNFIMVPLTSRRPIILGKKLPFQLSLFLPIVNFSKKIQEKIGNLHKPYFKEKHESEKPVEEQNSLTLAWRQHKHKEAKLTSEKFAERTEKQSIEKRMEKWKEKEKMDQNDASSDVSKGNERR